MTDHKRSAAQRTRLGSGIWGPRSISSTRSAAARRLGQLPFADSTSAGVADEFSGST
ncbi:hypothetical protein [Mycobacterium marinum]|uniref:hypothetical protein n=1 Tax=Mycobacterium marinum TaxID=1781 RepID=UPI00159531D0|nr:hypothetical protein [Mycobacterium marinum]